MLSNWNESLYSGTYDSVPKEINFCKQVKLPAYKNESIHILISTSVTKKYQTYQLN